MESIGTGFGGHFEDGLTVAVVGGEVVADDADFLEALLVGNDSGFVEAIAGNRKAIQLNVVGKGAAAVHTDGRKLRSTRNPDAECDNEPR